ncbi:MAG: 50S ribosomal protein L9 [Victivallales bacterium]|nr:50S ribosomal protein L9 [Victivallales bacterium]
MASTKLILLEDVENLGLAGDEVSVAPGYARNYLLPKNLAAKASPGTLRQLAARKEKIEEQRKLEMEKSKVIAASIEKAEITIQMQASEDDQLFGSVTDRVIADKLIEMGIEVDHNQIKLENHIKELGMFDVPVKLHGNVTATAKVWVVRA